MIIDRISVTTKYDTKGNLSILEGGRDIPFQIKRIFYIWNNTANYPRGGHAHKQLYQAFIAIHGSCNLSVDDGCEKIEQVLDNPSSCIVIPPGLWCDINNFSSDCALLVLASEYYNEDDYIRDYPTFLDYAIHK